MANWKYETCNSKENELWMKYTKYRSMYLGIQYNEYKRIKQRLIRTTAKLYHEKYLQKVGIILSNHGKLYDTSSIKEIKQIKLLHSASMNMILLIKKQLLKSLMNFM